MSSRTSSARSIVGLAVIAGLAVGVWQYQAILDQYALATFKPSAEVASIESRLGLTREGRAILYGGRPQVDSKAEFNQNCQTSSGSLELGCYSDREIFVLKIDNQGLAPEMDVVMAHELLHAAWVRLRPDERQRLGTLLEAAYARLADDDLKERMAQYAISEPGQRTNELHSILATEYTDLGPELEAYYARFFNDRPVIVAAHKAYQGVFDSRRQQLAGDLATIRSLKSQLASVNARMQALRASGDIAAYNALVPRQNALVDDINGRIDRYQVAVDEYNALSRSLDSQVITDTESNVQ